MIISHFIIDKVERKLSLLVNLADAQAETYLLSFEYLRISSPNDAARKNQTIISHKKQVQLLAIEPVAKHGFRFIFDDQHNAIYSDDYLLSLIQEREARWQTYLDELMKSGHSREAMIAVKQV